MNRIKKILKTYGKSFVKWVLIAAAVGAVSGVVGALFHKAISFATQTREENSRLIYFLPLAGIVITAMYRLSKQNLSTNTVIDCIRSKQPASSLLVPFIFIGAFLTHLFGGSAGREGAALQIGGGIGSAAGRLLKLKKESMGTIIMCGMSGAFSAIFTTPVTAAVFSMEVVSVGHIKYFRFLPCMLSSAVAFEITRLMGNAPLFYHISGFPGVSAAEMARVVLFSLAAAAISIIFCISLHMAEKGFKKYIKNPYIISALGGAIIVLLTLLAGTTDYNGAGMNIVESALSGSPAPYRAFALKLIFTAVTVGAGFKGGEIVPAFFVGTTFGCAFGAFFGLDPSFAAALGLLCMFCGISNCPFATLIMGVELFGSSGILYYALSCAVCFVMSGPYGLYSSQKLVYSKYSSDEIDRFSI
ncbi:MAG: chloride channel protein [Clostridia bacterium]|nr:chloride channel protein [Clostridia bacterium]